MKPLSSINTRLWLTYILLVAFILAASLSGIVVAFKNSPLLYWKEFTRLNYVTDSLVNRLDYFIDTRWSGVIELFLKEAELLEVRVIILDGDGNSVLDSGDPYESQLPSFFKSSEVFTSSDGNILVFQDNNRQSWFYKIRQINASYFLIAAVPRPNFQIQAIFQDELLKPLFRVGLIALVIAFLISWFVASWITKPLKKISDSAQQLASGDFPPILLEGPAEVQQLATVINNMDLKVRKSLQSQKDFVANVSHEFKTPLTSIRGFAQVLFDEAAETKEGKQHAAQIILEETGKLEYLVNDLLMLAKLDAGTMKLEKTNINVDQLIENILERFRFRIDEKSINIKKTGDKQITIFGDGERVAQVFNNLIENAIKFTEKEGSIEISFEEINGYAIIAIKDSGRGIPKEDISHIFDRFYQVDKSRKGGNDKGVGLGLAIARQIVITHGGELTVSSELNKGSCFVVKIPLRHEK